MRLKTGKRYVACAVLSSGENLVEVIAREPGVVVDKMESIWKIKE
jgi:hypothetical protein